MPGGILGRLFGGTLEHAVGEGIGISIGGALEPEAQAIRNEVWPLQPIVPHTPEQAAEMAVQGVLTVEEGAAEAVKSGIHPSKFHQLYLVNGSPIAPEQALDLWNRGEITEHEVDRALLQSRLKPEWVDTLKKLSRQILQLGELAEMVTQAVITEQEGVQRAAMLGVSSEDFLKLVHVTGNPPGPETTLSMWNRGLISEEEATTALRQSRLKPEWIDRVKRSRIRPQSVADAVRGVIKQRLTMAQGLAIAEANGIAAETFQNLVDAAGRPIGIQQALQLFNRKHYTAADVERVVAYSDVRTEYLPDILKLAVRYPSILQIRQLVQHGSITDEKAIEYLVEQGYPHDLAESVVIAGHAVKTKAEKDLTKSEISSLFISGAISRDVATGLITDLGYDATEAGYVLDLAEFRRIGKYLEAAISRVHNQYVNHKIGSDTVTTEFDRIGVPTEQREQLLDLWGEERGANVKVLTPAQVVRAFKKELIDQEAASGKLIEQGYTQDDAAILLSI